MRRLVGVIASVVLALFATSGRLAAQGGTVRGRVADTSGARLALVSVSSEAIGARATTNEKGEYEIRGVRTGTHSVRARVLGYVPQIVRVTVTEAQPARQDFALHTQPIGLAPVDVVVGSRARHAASDELAVPVDVFTSEQMQQQGTTEMSQVLQALAPSVNFPHQSVTDAGDIGRPFTLRGLSPDQTLVLLNGWRRHQTALVNNFTYGMGAGSSGVDLNTIPQSAIDRMEVLRDGASGLFDSVNTNGQVVVKRNAVPQPNQHWGDGLEKDIMTLGNLRLPLNAAGTSEFYAFGGYSFRKGTGNAYRRYASNYRNWPDIYPLGYLPEFSPHVTEHSAAGGWRAATGGWSLDVGASFGHNHFDYDLTNTLNMSLGPCLDPNATCAPDAPGIPNKTSFYAGRLRREEFIA